MGNYRGWAAPPDGFRLSSRCTVEGENASVGTGRHEDWVIGGYRNTGETAAEAVEEPMDLVAALPGL